MNYEEKYKNALDMAKECMKDGGISQNTIDYLCNIFPELAEAKDEKIRKGLIENFKWFCGDFPETTTWGKDDDMLVKDIITWLEKQGKQKSILCKNDISHIDSLLKRLEGLCRNEFERTRYAISEDEKWLKSLRKKIFTLFSKFEQYEQKGGE